MAAQRDLASELERTESSLRSAGTVSCAIVFGSVARGSARPDSDIDVAVLGARTDVLEVSVLISRATGRDAQVVNLEDVTIPLLEAIIADGIVVYEAVPGVAAAWRSRTLAMLELDRPWYALQRDAWLKKVEEQGL